MALIKDKVVTVESLSALHEHNKETYMTKNDGWNLSDVGAVIPENSNLDDYIVAGNYYCTEASVSKTIINTPSTESGFRLIVMNGYTSTRIYQIAFPSSNVMLERMYYNGTWTEWKRPLTNILTSSDYGDELPEAGTVGRIFFKRLTDV